MCEKFTLLVVMSLALVTGARATEIVWEKDSPLNGLPPTMEVKKNRWRSKTMVYPERFTDKYLRQSGPDFFTMEFGAPCRFNRDWLKDEGYASGPYKIENNALTFNTGKKGFSFGFGPAPGDKVKPALRFGSGWGRQTQDRYYLCLKLNQNVPETKWRFVPGSNRKSYDLSLAKTFTVKGKGDVTFKGEIGYVRHMIHNPGNFPRIMLECVTPNAEIKISEIEIYPAAGEIFFRKAVDLDEKPVMARCSFTNRVIGTLYVNGEKVDESPGVYPGGTVRDVNIAPYLKKGKNIIAYAAQITSWIGARPELLFEGVAVDKSGKVTRILGDKNWKCSLTLQKDWWRPDFNDSSWKTPKLVAKTFENTLLDNKKLFWGLNPLPMGRLDVAPTGRQHPIFEVGEKAAFTLTLPAGLAGSVKVVLDICHGGTDDVIKSVTASRFKLKGDLAESELATGELPVGPYRLNWKLLDQAGKTIEDQVGEVIIVGPISQETLPLSDFEDEFNKRLELVKRIDCAATPKESDVFVDHTGMTHTPAVNRGKVVEKDGLIYRETGLGRWDYFAYRLRGLEFGQPYMAEIIVPDNATRYIYSGVLETYPVNFCNNLAKWGRGWFTATGTCYTGMDRPISGALKKIRYIFYPGSKNSAIVVMSGFSGYPAAASAINIYKITGGLPALKLPETKRLFGSHMERMSTMVNTLGMSEQPLLLAKNIRMTRHQDCWFQLYKMFERKVRLMRFRGHNMAVEGAYMYRQGDYPSEKHCPTTNSDDSIDPFYLLLKMYKQNGIKCMLGFEYIASPQVYLQDKDGVSDRRMWRGETGTRLVDRHGRQLVSYMNGGWNFLNPDIARIMLDCVSELYQRYAKTGDVVGLFLVNGQWWLPTFNTRAYPELTDLEIGYDDGTVGLFEKETGVNLGIPAEDTARFEKRYQALTGKHLDMWKLWRAKKVREFMGEIAKRLESGKNKWPIYSKTAVNMTTNSPFLNSDASRRERDLFHETRCAEYGLPLDLYEEDENIIMVPTVKDIGKYASTPLISHYYLRGKNKSASVKRAIESAGAVYGNIGKGLDEVDCPAKAAERSVFDHTTRGVFIPRGVEDLAMADFVEAVNVSRPPKVIFDNWYDCNLTTGFGAQLRRFAAEFYAIPDGAFANLPEKNSKGLLASTATMKDGRRCLRLINNTPYPVAGYFQADADDVKDMVYDRVVSSGFLSGGKYDVSLKPYDIRLFALTKPDGDVVCEFNYPQDVQKTLRDDAEAMLNDSELLRKVPGDLIAGIFKALKRNDCFALYNIMNDFETVAQVNMASKARAAKENQARLLEDLKKGKARINCAASSVYVAPDGSRWLPDQPWRDDVAAYGNVGTHMANRGAIKIHNTNTPNVYRTEAYGGEMTYRIPVPNGTYNVSLCFAETYEKSKTPGNRFIAIAVEGNAYPKRIDPIQLAGGWCVPYVLEIKDVIVSDKLLEIDLTGNALINGVVIEKAK